MHRKALVLSLSCLTLVGMGACGTATPSGGPLIGSGNAPGSAAGTTATSGASGTTGTTAGASGGVAAGAGGVTAPGGAGGADSAGTAGSLVSGGSGGTSAGAGGGASTNGGSGGLLPAIPDARGIYGHPDPNTNYPTYAGFGAHPFLVEEFNNPIDLNRDPFWTWGDGALDDGKSRMVENNIKFENGNMVISLTADSVPGTYSHSAADFTATSIASGAEFRTIYNDFRYGRYEVRMKSPPGMKTGGGFNNFFHTMFVYRTPAFLGWREIDVETLASPQNNFISNIIMAPPGTRKWAPQWADAHTDFPVGGYGAQALPAGFNTASDYHTYAFEWLPEQIKWFVDGTLVRVKKDGVGANNLATPKDSTKIIMNMWIFGNADLGGGDPTQNQYPIQGLYDWFRFYKADIDTTYPCLNTPSCLPPADLTFAKNNPKDPLPDIRPAMCTSSTGMQDTPCGP